VAEGLEYRGIAERIGRDPLVVSREVRRHGGREGDRSHVAGRAAVAARRRPTQLTVDAVPRLSASVRHWLRRGWSPASVAGRLPADIGGEQAVRVSHEAIDTWVYAQPVSTLDRELIQLRSGRTARKSGPRTRPAPRIAEPRWIDERPAEAEGRAVPGHWEGDLVIGKNGRSAVATLVERTSRFLVLVPLAGQDSLSVSQAIIAMAGELPAPLKRSLTWDCGAEMARHSEITATQFPVYFAHPHSPWQRGSNENLNRLVREYLPKGTEITSDRDYLATIAAEINDRPRKIHDWKKPSEVFTELLAAHASTS